MVNTSELKNQEHQIELVALYNNSYLKRKKIEIVKGNLYEDRHWNLGRIYCFAPFVTYLMRTPKNDMLLGAQHNDVSIEPLIKQNLSFNLTINFLRVIAHLISHKYSSLPKNNLKIPFFNTHPMHSTGLMANFYGLDNQEYEKLYQQFYKEHKPDTYNKNSMNELEIKEIELALQNKVMSFLIKKKKITLPTVNSSCNYVLPLNVKQICLNHYDSFHSNEYYKRVRMSANSFIKKHNATITEQNCPKQEGQTCSDWTIYNLYRDGFYLKSSFPSSRQLRELTENKSIQLVDKILFPTNKLNNDISTSIKISENTTIPIKEKMSFLTNKENNKSFTAVTFGIAATILTSALLVLFFHWSLLPTFLLSSSSGFAVSFAISYFQNNFGKQNKEIVKSSSVIMRSTPLNEAEIDTHTAMLFQYENFMKKQKIDVNNKHNTMPESVLSLQI